MTKEKQTVRQGFFTREMLHNGKENVRKIYAY